MLIESKPVNSIPTHFLYYIFRKQAFFLNYNIHALRNSLGIRGAQEKVKHFPEFPTTPDLVPNTQKPSLNWGWVGKVALNLFPLFRWQNLKQSKTYKEAKIPTGI